MDFAGNILLCDLYYPANLGYWRERHADNLAFPPDLCLNCPCLKPLQPSCVPLHLLFHYTCLRKPPATQYDLTLVDLIRGYDHPLSASYFACLWPHAHTPPDITTLRRWLGHLVDEGLIVQTQCGMKNDAFRYGAVV